MKTFNKIGIALMAMMMCTWFGACSDDDEYLGDKNSPFYVNNLAGEWEISWSKGQDKQTGEPKEWDQAKEGFFLVFNKDRTGYNYEEGDSLKHYFIWKIKENQLSVKMQGEKKFAVNTIETLNDKEFVITLENDTFKITETYQKVIINDSVPTVASWH